MSILLIQGCSFEDTAKSAINESEASSFSAQITGKWIIEASGDTMLNPQTSGLIYENGYLYSVSDGSADVSQIQRLHKITPDTANIVDKYGPIVLSEKVRASCFASYLSEKPDYEAIVSVPNQQNAWLMVTEDATRAGTISKKCQQQYAATGSTLYPTLLVKIEKVQDLLMLTGVRAVQYSKSDNLGDFPNDGVEGLAITKDGRLLLGVERDKNVQARVFELEYSDKLFEQLDAFVQVKDAGLLFPQFATGKHPINGMDVFYPNDTSKGYLIAAARNHDQLWILDLSKQNPAKVVDIEFFAPSELADNCPTLHKIKNTSIEGVAIHQNTLFLINDPWKKVYSDNAVCPQDSRKYSMLSPLLFQLEIDPNWFAK